MTGGNGGFGQNGAGGAAGMNGQQQGQQGFLGRNTNQNQFLGRNVQGGQGGQGGNQNQTGNNRRGAANRNGGNQANNMANMMQQQNGQTNARGVASQYPPVRPRQTVGFTYSKPQLATVSVKLETRLTKRSELKAVSVSVDPSGDLVLKGQVASADDAMRAENLIRLEPGVQNIRNELTYPDAATEP